MKIDVDALHVCPDNCMHAEIEHSMMTVDNKVFHVYCCKNIPVCRDLVESLRERGMIKEEENNNGNH